MHEEGLAAAKAAAEADKERSVAEAVEAAKLEASKFHLAEVELLVAIKCAETAPRVDEGHLMHRADALCYCTAEGLSTRS